MSIKADDEKKGKHLFLILAVALGIGGVLLFLTLFGPTGDMTKSWNMDDVQKNSVYPKSQ
jgi:hypothetical protein